MALFQTRTHHRHRDTNSGGGIRPLVTPELMARQICHHPERHLYPIAMIFAGISMGRWGQPVAVHRCAACGRRRGLAIHFKSGRVFTLFQKG